MDELEEAIAAEMGDDDDTETQPAEPTDDDGTDDDDTDDDTQPEAEAVVAIGEDEIEEIHKKLVGLQKHVTKRLGEILGDVATEYQPCELCTWAETPGWRPPVQPPGEVLGALYSLLGQRDPSELLDDGHSTVCGECNGWGEVRTGSKVVGQDTLPCVRCAGKGWNAADDTRQGLPGTVTNGSAALPSPPAVTTSAPPPDQPPLSAEAQAARDQGYIVIPMTPVSS